jgi:hypothetical protein
MLRWIVAGFLLLGFLSGCTVTGGPQTIRGDASEGQEWVDTHIVRTVDEEAGVVCWVWYKTGGIDCLPLSQTLLGKE